MINEGASYDQILKEAQELGYAEADPTFDVGGLIQLIKLLILGSIAYGIDVKPEEILIEGIQNISKIDIEFAKEFEYNIKLFRNCKKVGNEIELRVHPVLVPLDKMIAKVDGVMNGVSVVGDKVGRLCIMEQELVVMQLLKCCIANIIDIARRGKALHAWF